MTRAYPYGRALMRLGGSNLATGGPFDFANDDFKVMLLRATYALTAQKLDTQEFVNEGTPQDPVSHELTTGLGYARRALSLPMWDYVDDSADAPGNIARFSDAAGAATTFPTFTGTFRYAAVYKVGPSDISSPLLLVVDFETDISVSDGNFVLQWAPEGILRLRAVQTTALPDIVPAGITFPIIFPFNTSL